MVKDIINLPPGVAVHHLPVPPKAPAPLPETVDAQSESVPHSFRVIAVALH